MTNLGHYGLQGASQASGNVPGTWTLVQNGTTALAANQIVDITLPGYPPATAVYSLVACQADAAGAFEVTWGTSSVAPPSSSVYYCLISGAGSIILRFRSGVGTGTTTNINWAVYQVVP